MNRVRTGRQQPIIDAGPVAVVTPKKAQKAGKVEALEVVAPLQTKVAPKLEAPALGPMDAVSAVILGALGPPSGGGPLTEHQALQLSRKTAHKILDALPALPEARLEQLLDHGRVALDNAKLLKAKDATGLAKAYVHLAEAETFAQAVLDEAIEGQGRAPKKKDREGYAATVDAARELLRDIGKHYAVRCGEFGKTMLGDKEWPTRYEKKDGHLEFINGFKSIPDLDTAGRAAAFEERLQKFLAGGGQLSSIIPLTKETLDRLEVGERYEYVLTVDGRFNFTLIPKTGDGPSPGHTLTAEAGFEFKDTRALCAGELWVARGTDGELSALCISAGSGHYKPFFDSLATVDPVLHGVGIAPAQIIHYGGPSSARDAARTLFAKAGVDDPTLPPRVHDLRLALHRAA